MLFAALRHAAVTDNSRVLFVHAGVDPRRQLVAQGDAFWWGGVDVLALNAPFAGFTRVVRGFDRDRRGLVEGRYGASLDAGAGRGGTLLAACFALDGSVVDLCEA
jgi:serine/threonine protein phosphatase 1